MYRFALRLIAVLVPLFALLAGAMLLLGPLVSRDSGGSLQASGFTICRLPCWAGIVPGETRFDDAAGLVRANVPAVTSGPSARSGLLVFGGSGFSGVVNYAGGMAGEIRLAVEMRLNYLFAQLGAPHCIWRSTEETALVIHWEAEGRTVSALTLADEAGNLTPASLVTGLSISNGVDACDQPVAHAWIGFTPMWRYHRAG